MSWKARLLLLIALVASAGILAFFFSVALPKATPAPEPVKEPTAAQTIDRPMITFIDPSKGPTDAKTVIVVYADYSCPFCKEMNQDVNQLFTAHPGEFRVVWKNIPNAHYPGSDMAAEGALCAKEQGRFWEFHDILFDKGSIDEIELSLIANTLGMNVNAFAKCVAEHAAKPIVERTVAEAVALGIDETPSVFVDGRPYSGAMTYGDVQAFASR